LLGLYVRFMLQSRGAKVALKQAHGGPKRRPAKVRSVPVDVKRAVTEFPGHSLTFELWITRGASV
jgi:hypothetical protein